MWKSLKSKGHREGHWAGSSAKAASSPVLAWPTTGQGLRALRDCPGEGGGPLEEAGAFFPCTPGRRTPPLLTAAASAQWPRPRGGAACSLPCREQDCGACLPRSGPRPGLSMPARAHPRTRQRKDSGCLPACWDQPGRGSVCWQSDKGPGH